MGSLSGFQSHLAPDRVFILYTVNIKNKYKQHIVLKDLPTARKIKQRWMKLLNLKGNEVFINKQHAFFIQNKLHCFNGYKYNASTINGNQHISDDAVVNLAQNSSFIQ
jgi:hypothetical protein